MGDGRARSGTSAGTGEIYPSWLGISSIKDASGRITNFLGIFADISVIKQAAATRLPGPP